MKRRLLVTGASGYLGREVVRQATAAGWDVTGLFMRAPKSITGVQWMRLDVRDVQGLMQLVGQLRPHAVIHAAIVEPSEWSVNVGGAVCVAQAARNRGSRLVHVSSDAIFSGASGLYDEHADPEPITAYGAAKAAAETAVHLIDPSAAIVRTSLIIGDEPYKHVQMVLDMADGKRHDALFSDEIRCPVAVDDLAAALLELADNDYSGILNVAGTDALSRYELGVLIAKRWGRDPRQLRSSTTAASGLRRPTDVRLDIRKAQQVLRTPLRGARTFLAGETT